MMANSILTQAELRKDLAYDPLTGQFTRLVSSSSAVKVGDVAGSAKPTGRIYICVRGIRYAAHRLAWLYVHGTFPSGIIDHINGDSGDNRIVNLRDVDHTINNENKRAARSDSHHGVLGVGYCKHHRKWKARIRVDGRFKHIAYCDTIEEAGERYLEAKRRLHRGCTI